MSHLAYCKRRLWLPFAMYASAMIVVVLGALVGASAMITQIIVVRATLHGNVVFSNAFGFILANDIIEFVFALAIAIILGYKARARYTGQTV